MGMRECVCVGGEGGACVQVCERFPIFLCIRGICAYCHFSSITGVNLYKYSYPSCLSLAGVSPGGACVTVDDCRDLSCSHGTRPTCVEHGVGGQAVENTCDCV